MAGSASNYASCYQVEYQAAGVVHKLQIRPGSLDGSMGAGQLSNLTGMMNAFGNILPSDFRWLSAKRRAQGSDIFVPTTMPSQPTSLATNGWDSTDFTQGEYVAGCVRIQGTSAGGNPMSLTIFGANRENIVQAGRFNQRIVSSEEPRVATVLSSLNGINAVGADRLPVTWSSSWTFKIHDYWRKRLLI